MQNCCSERDDQEGQASGLLVETFSGLFLETKTITLRAEQEFNS